MRVPYNFMYSYRKPYMQGIRHTHETGDFGAGQMVGVIDDIKSILDSPVKSTSAQKATAEVNSIRLRNTFYIAGLLILALLAYKLLKKKELDI